MRDSAQLRQKKKPKPSQSGHARGNASAAGHTFIVGRNPVGEFLSRKENASRVVRALTQLSPGGMDAKGEMILELLRSCKIPTKELHKDELSRICQTSAHQGFALEVRPKELLDLHGLVRLADQIDEGIIIALDGVQDPQNLGSILRSAEFLGAKAVFWSHNRNVSLTPVVSKVSAGASELLPMAEVANIRDALEKLRKQGFWSVASVISDDAQGLSKFEFPRKCLLIMGSEGGGVRPLVAKEADFRVFIERRGATESLNVSQATAILVGEYARQHAGAI